MCTRGGNPGLFNLERAGLRDLVAFHNESSHSVLPRLEAEGTQLDFAFIDGLHHFDWALHEFFLIDKMLRIGGLVIFDDLSWPAVQRVLMYVLANRAYEDLSPTPPTDLTRTIYRRARRLAHGLKAVPPFCRYVLGRQESYSHSSPIYRNNHVAVLRKLRDDDPVKRGHHHSDIIESVSERSSAA